MDGFGLLLLTLTLIFLGIVYGMNIYNTNLFSKKKEGFEDTPTAEGVKESPLAPRIRAVLDPMATPYQNELCEVFKMIRDIAKKNIVAEKKISQADAAVEVEADLRMKIPGGALPCPLLSYPKASATDVEWLQWLQTIPKDFGARVVLMALYAQSSLAENRKGLEDSLAQIPKAEGFETICTPDLAETRRSEDAAKGKSSAAQSCILPEKADSQTIEKQVTKLLEVLVAEKTKILSSKSIDPSIDIGPIVASAKQNALWLEEAKNRAESGTLLPQ